VNSTISVVSYCVLGVVVIGLIALWWVRRRHRTRDAASS
jgi:hypothetical protein